ncbi:peptidase S8/S53 domain-containing protein [Xylogone sp. PMI_703]|nr:peptidase S8/S53 domain-containing protein [Xylogone sp. PMI_703]
MAYPAIGAFAHVSTLNDTMFQIAQKSEVVGTVIRNEITFPSGSQLKRCHSKKKRYASMESDVSSDFIGHNSSATWFDDSGNGYNGQDYAYEQSAGAGVTIYVVDTGVDHNHPEFQGRNIDRYIAVDVNPGDTSGIHGTAVASMAVGATLGVATNANLVDVTVKWSSETAIWDGLHWAYNDVVTTHPDRKGKAIINMSFGAFINDPTNDWFLRDLLQCINNGITLVAAAGNFGDGEGEITSGNLFTNIRPASYSAAIPGLISVGSADTTATCITAYAQGVNWVAMAGTTGYREKLGTSYATSIISGLAAYILSHPNVDIQQYLTRAGVAGTAEFVSNLIQLWSYQRSVLDETRPDSPSTPNVAWNGLIVNSNNLPIPQSTPRSPPTSA